MGAVLQGAMTISCVLYRFSHIFVSVLPCLINAALQHTPLEAVQSMHTCLQWETKKPQISSWLAPSSHAQLGLCHSKTEVDIKSFLLLEKHSPVVKALEGCGTGKFGDCFFLDCLKNVSSPVFALI